MKLFRILAIVLLALTAVEVVLVVDAFSPDPLPFPEYSDGWFVLYQANEISKPLVGDCWNLSDPDPYILEAIAEHWAMARANETTFVYQVWYEHGQVWEIEYAGHYYSVDCLYNVDPNPFPHIHILSDIYRIRNARHEKELAIVSGPLLGFSWIAVGTVWLRKKPEPTS
jgi:hypothetical protein